MVGYNPKSTRREFMKLAGSTGIKALYFTKFVGPLLGLSACLGEKKVTSGADVESKRAELEETIEREVGSVIESKPSAPAQKTKNIWIANPAYVGRGADDFLIPDELKGSPIERMACPRGGPYAAPPCIVVQNRLPDNYALRSASYGEINKLGLIRYEEIYVDGKIRRVDYSSDNFGVSLRDKDGNGIIDWARIVNEDGTFLDEYGSGNLKMIKGPEKTTYDPFEKASEQIENKIKNEISSQLGIP